MSTPQINQNNENLPPTSQSNSENTKPELTERKLNEIVDSLPVDKRAGFLQLMSEFLSTQSLEMSMEKTTHLSGPFPHPDILKGMESVVPGSAEKIVQMAIDQS